METDTLLDGTLCCMTILAESFISLLSTAPGTGMLFLFKFGGIGLDIMAIWQAKETWELFVSMIIFMLLDRIGALILILIFGIHPSKYYKEYAYYKTKEFKSIRQMKQKKKRIYLLREYIRYIMD
eukprot:32846_1